MALLPATGQLPELSCAAILRRRREPALGGRRAGQQTETEEQGPRPLAAWYRVKGGKAEGLKRRKPDAVTR